MITLQDLGVLRDLHWENGWVIVTITPTYSGCPAIATMREDLEHQLRQSGFPDVHVRVQLWPPWSSDDITENGKALLAEAGISPPGTRPEPGPVMLTLQPTHRNVLCPLCGSAATAGVTEFGSTPCKALYRCTDCCEIFEHFKEI